MGQMSIGEFARDSRLSAKALRLYDELGLLPPARVDEDSGYRFYEPGQLKQARLIVALRQLQVPLAEIKAILPLEPVQAAERVREVWAATEAEHTSRRALAAYLIDELSGKRSVVYEVSTREMPERSLLCLKRNVAGGIGHGRSARSSSPCSGTTSCHRYRDAPARSSVSSGGKSARTATARWSGAVPSQQTRRKHSPPAARS